MAYSGAQFPAIAARLVYFYVWQLVLRLKSPVFAFAGCLVIDEFPGQFTAHHFIWPFITICIVR